MSYTVNKADQIALREMLESIQFTGDAERRKNLPDVSDPEDDEPSAKVRRVRTPAGAKRFGLPINSPIVAKSGSGVPVIAKFEATHFTLAQAQAISDKVEQEVRASTEDDGTLENQILASRIGF